MKVFKNFFGSAAYHIQRSHKIEGLADGVFAIVMTLLVLDIRVPVHNVHTDEGVSRILHDSIPKILTFILSFSVAGQFWSIFTNQFNYVHKSDRNEIILAMFFLMAVSLLPFSTSLLSEHLWSKVATGFYIFNLLLILFFHTLHWYYAFHNGHVKEEGNERSLIHKAIMNRAKTAFFAYLTVAGCCFYSSYLALCGTICTHIIFSFSGFLEMLRTGRRRALNHAGSPASSSKLPELFHE